MIVVDTNVIAYLYITGKFSDRSDLLLSRDPDWAAPILWKSEFRSVLAQYLRKGFLDLHSISLMLEQAESLMKAHEYEVPSIDVLQLVSESNCSSYDCEFVALARYLNVPFVTADQKIIEAFPTIARDLSKFIA